MVLVEGEAGIGKSRLTQVLREQIAGEPHTALRYQCSPYHLNSALYPITEQLEFAVYQLRELGGPIGLRELVIRGITKESCRHWIRPPPLRP